MAGQELEGIDIDGVTTWVTANVDGIEGPLSFTRIPGGHSNLTYDVTDGAGNRMVVRRPPLGELLPSAHDMSREWKLISALGPTPVPVPPALGFCEDPDVTGAWFYVMGFVDGHVLHDEETAIEVYDEAQRRRSGDSLASVLAALHAVDVNAVGLGDLGKHDGYIARVLRRWYGQYQDSMGATPLVDELHASMSARIPDQQKTSVVHGDYRLGNCLTDEAGNVVAVLDWEICTLGDPLADLGYMVATWSAPDDGFTSIASSPSTAPGFQTRDEMAAAYAATTDLDTSEMDFYVAFSFWKVACINQGVWARYVQGQKSSEGVDLDDIRASVDKLAAKAAEAFERL